MNKPQRGSRIAFFLSLALALCLASAPALAQIGGQASLVGTVTDPSGAILPGAEITVKNELTGSERQTVTNDSGNYVVERLQPGEYSVTAEMSGFKRQTVEGLILQVAERARVNLSLAIGDITEEVIVEGGRPVISTENGTIEEVINEEEVRLLPLNGRNFLQLTTLTPGVVDSGNGIVSNARGTVAVNGYGDLGNNIMLDGISNQADGIAGRMNFAPSLEMVKEFKVQSSVYSAEYGRAGGAQINIVSKRGTNQYHGSLFYFHRNSAQEARNFFQVGELPKFRRNDFGASIGGPIDAGSSDPNHFFFFAWESRRQGRGLTSVQSVPTPALKNGDFSAFSDIIYDPLTLNAETGQRQPFPNNQIPANRIAPQTAFFLQFYPDPQLPGITSNYVANPTRTEDFDQFSIRYDGDFSDSDSLMVRLTWNDSNQLEPLGLVPVATPISGFGEIVNFKGTNQQGSWTHTFSPSAINTFSFGHSTFESLRSNEQTGRNFFEEAGISGVEGVSAIGGSPWLIPAGWMGIGDDPFNPQTAPMDNWQWADTVTQVTGNHSLKYGVDFIWNTLDLNPFNALDRGAMFFNPVYTTSGVSQPGNNLNAWGDFLLGFPASTTTRIAPLIQDLSQWWFMTFVQDDWQVSSNLTVNLGLRYEVWRRPIEKQNRMSVLEAYRLPEPAFVVAGSPEAEAIGLPRSLDDSDLNDFGPRIGFAYRLGGSDRWVLRGGYGLFYQWIVLDKQNNFGLGPPFNAQVSLTNNPDLPAFTIAEPYNAPVLPSASGNGVPPDNRTPYNQQFSLTVAHELTPSVGIEFGYVGSAARKNQFGLNINQAAPGPGPSGPRQPFPDWAGITQFANWGTSNYNSFQLTIRKDPGVEGLSLLTTYTWSKALATSVTGGNFHLAQGVRDTSNWKADAGPSPLDTRHRLSVSYLYELPFGRGKAVGSDVSSAVNQVIGGWQVGGISSFQKGNWLTPGAIVNYSNSGGSRPDLVGNPNNGPKTISEWFNTSAFATPAAYNPGAGQFTFGNAGVGLVEGPGFAIFDIAIYKDFFVTESHRFQFRTEFFNAFNHTNFTNPNMSFGSGAFGRISGARDARQIQFGLRYDF